MQAWSPLQKSGCDRSMLRLQPSHLSRGILLPHWSRFLHICVLSSPRLVSPSLFVFCFAWFLSAVCYALLCFIPFAVSNPCNEVLSKGEGTAALTRFYYDAEKRQCLPFNYLGTKGNTNNFLSKEGCEVCFSFLSVLLKCAFCFALFRSFVQSGWIRAPRANPSLGPIWSQPNAIDDNLVPWDITATSDTMTKRPSAAPVRMMPARCRWRRGWGRTWCPDGTSTRSNVSANSSLTRDCTEMKTISCSGITANRAAPSGKIPVPLQMPWINRSNAFSAKITPAPPHTGVIPASIERRPFAAPADRIPACWRCPKVRAPRNSSAGSSTWPRSNAKPSSIKAPKEML